jgi:imidazolonepropionase-like amidohydrolase
VTDQPLFKAPLDLRITLASLFLSAGLTHAQAPAAPKPVSVTLFQNVRVFDGKSAALSRPLNVLVRGNRIEKISPSPIPTDRTATTRIIDGAGKTLMPGLIDAHWHAMLTRPSVVEFALNDFGFTTLVAGQEAQATLLRGFTTVRDLGGPTFGLMKAINTGVIPGPRIYPSGATISQTGGHGDFRLPYEVPRMPGYPPNRAEATGVSMIADGPDEVLRRTREQLMLGASQIKLNAGGGVASNYDPLDVTQYTEAEFRAAVSAAENWGTYVTVHAYTPRAIQVAIAGGVRCIDHGQLIDEPTAKLMAEKGIWLSLQPFLDDEDAIPFAEGSLNRAKQLEMVKGTDNAYALAKKYKLKTAWGTDVLFDPGLAKKQGKQLAKLTRWYTPAEVLVMATSNNAELLAMSGPRNPYPGKLGVVEEGALADLLLVDGDPIVNIRLIEQPEKNFLIIMKDGQVYQDLLTRR